MVGKIKHKPCNLQGFFVTSSHKPKILTVMKKLMFALLFALPVFCLAQNTPKVSAWDGVAYAIKDYYKKNANDPKSIKYSEASLMMEFNNGKFSQRVKVRGKNAFGATMLNEVYFVMSGTGMNAKVVAAYNKQEFERYGAVNSIKIVRKYDSDGSIVY
jgi:hypothetical protein